MEQSLLEPEFPMRIAIGVWHHLKKPTLYPLCPLEYSFSKGEVGPHSLDLSKISEDLNLPVRLGFKKEHIAPVGLVCALKAPSLPFNYLLWLDSTIFASIYFICIPPRVKSVRERCSF